MMTADVRPLGGHDSRPAQAIEDLAWSVGFDDLDGNPLEITHYV